MIRASLPMMLAASVAALTLVACGGPEPEASMATPTETAAMSPAMTPDSGVVDFVQKASLSNMFEVDSAKIALERSKVQAVKDFAQNMIDAHSPALNELGSLASSAMVEPPTMLDNSMNDKLTALRDAKVEDFDDVYLDQQTEAHENALNLVKSFSENGADPGLRAFAAKMTPDIQAHLDTVRALDKSEADDITKKPSDS